MIILTFNFWSMMSLIWISFFFFGRKNLQKLLAGVNVYADVGVKLALIIYIGPFILLYLKVLNNCSGLLPACKEKQQSQLI